MDRRFPRRQRIAALAALGAVALFAGTAGADPDDGQLGGPPAGGSGDPRCPVGAAVTGLTGEVGVIGPDNIVATIDLVCEGGGTPTGDRLGDPDSHPESGIGSTTCAAGDVAIGILGREGDYLFQIRLRCQDASLTGAASNAATTFGGTAGQPDGPYRCPAGQQLIGLDGSVDFNLVRHVEIVCAAGPVTARCGGKDATHVGTSGKDVLVGTPNKDVIAGLGGSDTIRGLGAGDVLCGNDGGDKIMGGSGNDTLLGAKGNDAHNGGAGRDLCNGGPGRDTARKCEVERSI